MALLLAPAVRAQPSFVIHGDRSVGGFRVYEDHGRLSQAIAVLGEPATVERARVASIDGACVVRWPSLGLSMVFFSYAKTCVPERSCFYQATITGQRWRTAKGLRIGDSRQRLYRLYPRVKGLGAWRALLIVPGLEGTFPAVEAKLVNRRVAAFGVTAVSCEAFSP